MTASDAVKLVCQLGGEIVATDSSLRLVLPKHKATPELIAALKEHKEELLIQLQEKRCESVPGKQSIPACEPKTMMSPVVQASMSPGMDSVYHRCQEKVLAMLEKVFPKAAEMGWTAEELFMLRHRIDLSGLVGLLSPDDRIIGVTPESIEIQNARGVHQKFYRRDHSQPWLTRNGDR